ncbi:hypothetical protein F4780DRAFT_304576 [Xylariomycetidae sp. FL0641]|nr:hypothetical protein F4780DRAFT_304576 [Xylariomycetidae sp. FL0641]
MCIIVSSRCLPRYVRRSSTLDLGLICGLCCFINTTPLLPPELLSQGRHRVERLALYGAMRRYRSMSLGQGRARRPSWSTKDQLPPATRTQTARTDSTVSEDIEMVAFPPCATTASTLSHGQRSEKASIANPSPLARFWGHHVSATVDRKQSRDHLALERTFLGYLRTSGALATTGVLIAQLTVLQQKDTGFGWSLVGKPLALCCYGCAICTVGLGACRFWRYQHTLRRDHALSGGFELNSIALLSLALVGIFLGFVIAIDTPNTAAP